MSEYKYKIDLNRSEDQFYSDHQIDGRIVFPAAGYIVMVWQMIAKSAGKSLDEMPIKFENLKFHRTIHLDKCKQTDFIIKTEDSGGFNVSIDNNLVFSGIVTNVNHNQWSVEESKHRIQSNESKIVFNQNEFYKQLKILGYDYGQAFRMIQWSTVCCDHACFTFDGNWVTAFDALLQVEMLYKSNIDRDLSLPKAIRCLQCDPRLVTDKSNGQSIDMICGYDSTTTTVRTFHTIPLVITGIETCRVKRVEQRVTNECYHFVPYFINHHDNPATHTSMSKMTKQHHDKWYWLDTNKRLIKLIDTMKTFTLMDFDNLLHNSNYLDSLNNLIKYIISNLFDIILENKLSSTIRVLEVVTCNFISRKRNFKQYLTDYFSEIEYTKIAGFQRESCMKCSDKETIEQKLCGKNQAQLLICDLTMSHLIANAIILLKNIIDHDNLSPNSFIITIRRTTLTPIERLIFALIRSPLPDVFSLEQDDRFILISQISICSKLVIVSLFRKAVPKLISDQTLISIKSLSYEWIKTLKDKLREHRWRPEGHNVWLIASDYPLNELISLVNFLRKEQGGDRIRCLSLNGHHKNIISKPKFVSKLIARDLVMNVVDHLGRFGSYRRIINNDNSNNYQLCRHAVLNIDKFGDLSSFDWFESKHKLWPIGRKCDQNLIHVYYSALNFKDIMFASGRLNAEILPKNECIIGSEYSGRDVSGQRVMGIKFSEALATTLVAHDSDFFFPIPDHWSMEEASTVPSAYATAYYALVVRGRLQQGETVLVHCGAGAVGQAAIRIALHMGAKVYTTVSSKEKRDYLAQVFPQLNDQSFANSRDLSFESQIMHATNGRGVDLLLNSLARDKLQASVRCMAQHGRFLEIGKYDMMVDNKLGMSFFLKNIQFHAILFDSLLGYDLVKSAELEKRSIKELICDGIQSGVVVPLRRTVFDVKQTEDAFRFMASGKHIGKVVIKLRDEEPGHQMVFAKPIRVRARKRTVFSPIKSYVIIGGLDDFGLELIEWMFEKGARNVVLNSRSDIETNYQRSCIERIRRTDGVRFLINKDNLSKYKQAENLLWLASCLGRVGGIFNLELELNNRSIDRQSVNSFLTVCEPKISMTTNLDQISRSEGKHDLDYFVVFSSVMCTPGHSNHGITDSMIERLCECRRRDGLHGLAIEWGAIGDIRYVNEFCGSVPQTIQSCLQVLDKCLHTNRSVLCSHFRTYLK